jgi:uncharacterized protein (DUF58 family)
LNREEIFRKIRTFSLSSRKLSRSLRVGSFRSVFQGQGIEFDEVRPWQAGDDVRVIDRNVSARMAGAASGSAAGGPARPWVKLYREEREMTFYVVLDASPSMFSASKGPGSRFEQAVLAMALLGFSADRAAAPFGALFFADRVNAVFRAARGRSPVLRVVNAALNVTPTQPPPQGEGSNTGSNLADALKMARSLSRRRGFVVILSDCASCGADWEQPLEALASGCDCLAVRITDPIDEALSGFGLEALADSETCGGYAAIEANTGGRIFRARALNESWAEFNQARTEAWKQACKKAGCSCMELSTTDDPAASLLSWFSTPV